MATTTHALIQQQVRNSDPPRDVAVNSMYFRTDADGITDPAHWTALGNKILNGFIGLAGGFTKYSGRAVTIKLYDWADAKPRPVKAAVSYLPTTWETSALGPRCVATCLSFYSGRNVPRQRGRIFLGPWNSNDLGEFVNSSLRTQIIGLGTYLMAGLTPTGFSETWYPQVHSVTSNNFNPWTNIWTNDTWDVIHSRLPKEVTRSRYP